MRNVLMLGPVPPPFGGIASVMQTIINSPLNKHYTFDVFDRGHEIPQELKGPLRRNIFRMKRFWKFFQKLHQRSYDFVHLQIPFGDSFPGTIIFMIIARILGARVLLHIHGTDWDTFYTRESKWLKVLYWIGLRIPKQIIVLYDTWRVNISKIVPNACVKALANCLEDIEPPSPASVQRARAKLGVNDHELLVLTVGFVGWRKGHLDILDAVPEVIEANEAVRFVFIGGEEYPGDSNLVISRIENENLSRWVFMTNEAPRSEIPLYLASADIFLLPSRREGMPISILEAMRAGLPVIVTTVGAIPEMVIDRKSGILIEPSAPKAIANAVIDLSRDVSFRKRLAQDARKAFETQFEVNACIKDLALVYEAMCENTKCLFV